MIIETENVQHENCVKRRDEATGPKKIQTVDHVRRIWQTSYQKVFKHEHETEDLRSRKLETDRRNGITTSMHIFLV